MMLRGYDPNAVDYGTIHRYIDVDIHIYIEREVKAMMLRGYDPNAVDYGTKRSSEPRSDAGSDAKLD
jgi:hypothetical protein